MYISQYCCNATVAVLALSHHSIALGENEDRTLSRQIASCVTLSSKNGGTNVVTVRQCDSEGISYIYNPCWCNHMDQKNDTFNVWHMVSSVVEVGS